MEQFVCSSVSNDFGNFIKVGQIRVRKSLIVSYLLANPTQNAQGDTVYCVNLNINGAWNSAVCESQQHAEQEVQRLDWIFAKEME